jgi:hypothetical protein
MITIIPHVFSPNCYQSVNTPCSRKEFHAIRFVCYDFTRPNSTGLFEHQNSDAVINTLCVVSISLAIYLLQLSHTKKQITTYLTSIFCCPKNISHMTTPPWDDQK